MPPTSNFGQDITNTNTNDNTNNNNNNNNNGREGGGGGGADSNNGNTMTMIERMGGRMMLPKLAGRGVIRVVGRCEDAKENRKLGKSLSHKGHKEDIIKYGTLNYLD